MYCPVCGGKVFAQLFGGTCSQGCVYCNKAVYCRDVHSHKLEPDSYPVSNPLKAIILRLKYNRIKANKEKGQKNLSDYKKHRLEAKEDARRMLNFKKRK